MGLFDKLFSSNKHHRNTHQSAQLQREIEDVRQELERIRTELSSRMEEVERRIKERDQ